MYTDTLRLCSAVSCASASSARACRGRFAPTHWRGQTNGTVPRYWGISGGQVNWALQLKAAVEPCLFAACWSLNCATAMSIGRVHKLRMTEALISICFFVPLKSHFKALSPAETDCAVSLPRHDSTTVNTPHVRARACTFVAGTQDVTCLCSHLTSLRLV